MHLELCGQKQSRVLLQDYTRRKSFFSVENPLHVGMKLQKEWKQRRDETTKMVEKRHKMITLHLFHALDGY